MKMQRVAAVLLACVLFLGGCRSGESAGAVQAAMEPVLDVVTETVYVTRTGSKYHRQGCRYLKDSCKEVELEEAAQQGYEPCSVCKPPV